MKKLYGTLAVLASITLFAQNSKAQEDPWEFRVTPYLWVATLNSSSRIDTNPPVETDSSFSIVDVLDFAFLGTGEVRKGDWGLIAEFNYLALSNDATWAGGLFNAEMELDGWMGGAVLAYRFFRNERATAEFLGGVRVWSFDAGIDFDRLPAVSRSTTLIDPIFGFRGSLNLNKDFFIDGQADIGGFGVGSDLQWEVLGRVGYRFNDTISASIGYRHLVIDLRNEGLDLNATMTGPFLAVDFTW